MVLCGTGHRPDKLGGYGPVAKQKLFDLAYWFLGEGPDREKVISGGALGWDQALAAAAISLKIPTVLALPFEGFECKWPKESQEYLHSLMNPAEVVFVCDPGYAPWKMQERNKWMVDHSDRVLALWNGTDGGTANCVRYAEKVGKPITNLWEVFNGPQH